MPHTLLLPCPLGLEHLVLQETKVLVQSMPGVTLGSKRSAVFVHTPDLSPIYRLNLHSRTAQRVLITLGQSFYRQPQDLYAWAFDFPWEQWWQVTRTFKIEITANKSPLQSLNFAALKIKDAIADRFRERSGERPNVDTHSPDVRIHVHLDANDAYWSIDTSGEPLFKRGWRTQKGDAPMKENLAASLLLACDWPALCEQGLPFYDPFCGSGTLPIEAAQIACRYAPGLNRRFTFEALECFEAKAWQQTREEARSQIRKSPAPIFGSDLTHRMVDFAAHNASNAKVSEAIAFRAGDALDRLPPSATPGLMVINPPYGERITTRGHTVPDDFFLKLAAHWKTHYDGWRAFILSPEMDLPRHMHLKTAQRLPVWNGPIECRLFRFDIAGRTMN